MLNLNKVGNSIISQLTDETSRIADKQMLHNRLRKQFTGKSILIVLDDMWEEDPDNLNDLMTMLKLGTRRKVIVIVTTRDEAIAKIICGPTVTPYKLEILTDDMCWTIIKQKTGFKDRVDKKQLEGIGMEIAIKCGGVALAAHSLGYMLREMMSDQWESLCENYVTQLLGMSFLQYSKTPLSDRKHDKDATLFTMHDLVHDLTKEILSHQINTEGNKCRYALLTDCSSSLQLSVAFPANIKALHFRDCGKQELCGDAFSPAKCLCVLDLSECFIQKLPDCIGQLKQLRLLYAPRIQDKMIPNCITELSELNYLDLRGSKKISALPELIGDMKALVHLDLSYCYEICKLPVSFAELK
ncbi:putative disease resistance protein RGA1 [Aegilops tauschii subsp. strangulata]|uniref:Putative disease resistance protein RGA1 n=2 Tax=Triticinae TaxID=1648030 RepID=R7W417_AEGTA